MSYFFRARANILGAIGAGKTALIRQLIADQTYADTSSNIEIREYNLETSQKSIKVELWDFKRDVINNETYRIFCASNCLYILVVNIRNQNEDLDNWLYLIQKYSRNSSVLIVRNTTEVEHGNYEKRLFKSSQYNFIHEVVSVNLHKKLDVDEFKRKFHEYIEQKNSPFSQNEENIINHLKSFRAQRYIELYQFKIICNNNHINNEEEYKNLLAKLDSLGVCIHLPSRPNCKTPLNRIVFLDTEWIVLMLNQALEMRSINLSSRVYSEDYFRGLWDNRERELDSFLLYILIEFNLCFVFKGPIPNHNQYFLPSFLNFYGSSPLYDEGKEVYSLIYPYEDLENIHKTQFDDIFANLTANLSDMNLNHSEIYKDRFLLRNNASSAIAEVFKSSRSTQYRIYISAPKNQASDLVQIAAYELDRINKDNGLLVTKKVPCNCKICSTKKLDDKKRVLYNLDDLKSRDPSKLVYCSSSNEAITVQHLMEGIMNKPQKAPLSDPENPWILLIFVLAFLLIFGAFALTAKYVDNWWIIHLTIVGSITAFSFVLTFFQLYNNRLTQKNFLTLMFENFKRMTLIQTLSEALLNFLKSRPSDRNKK